MISRNNKLVTAGKMRELEQKMFSKGMNPAILMEEAACAVTNYITSCFAPLSTIVIVCGKGNNGGDGYAAARQLFCRGYNVKIVTAAGSPKTPEAAANYNLAEELGIAVTDDIAAINNCDVIVDSILGTGIKGDVDIDAINVINNASAYKIAVDIPSGICSDTGIVCKNAVKADATITLGYKKTGLCLYPGAYYAGKIITAPISVGDFEAEYLQPDTAMISSLLPHPAPDAHKGNMGRLLVIAGSVGMTGAACFACMGALRTGCGLVSLAVPENLNGIMETKLTEAMTLPLSCTDTITFEAFSSLKNKISIFNAAVIGPGLGKSEEVYKIIEYVLKNDIPVIIDADGINSIVANIDILKDASAPVILTPHPAEFSRISGIPTETVQKNRINAARTFAVNYKVTVVLKGAGSVVAFPDGKCIINNTGNAGMATGGSGDILAGVIGALTARGLPPHISAAAGTYLHGLAGDIAAEKLGEEGMLPSDLLNSLPQALQRIRNSK